MSEGDALAKAFADYESTREDVARRTDPMRANSLLLAGAGLANAVKDHLVQLQVQAPVGEGLENEGTDLPRMLARLTSLARERDQVESTLAAALGYKPYPPGSPGHTPGRTNYAIGDHTLATLAAEAAAGLGEKLDRVEGENLAFQTGLVRGVQLERKQRESVSSRVRDRIARTILDAWTAEGDGRAPEHRATDAIIAAGLGPLRLSDLAEAPDLDFCREGNHTHFDRDCAQCRGKVPILEWADRIVATDPVNSLAKTLLIAWGEADPRSKVAQHHDSYAATFADMARAVLAAQNTTGMDQRAAFNATVELARERGMEAAAAADPSLGWEHLLDLQARMQHADFSRSKLGRWLGWAQAAVVAAGIGVTLDDMKQINLRYADTPPSRAN